MSKFNKDASIDDKVFQLHECLEDLKEKSLDYARRNELENKALRRGHIGIARRMNAMNTHVAEIEGKINTNSGLIATAAEKATSAEKKISDLNSNAWKFLLGILGTILAAGIVAIFGLAYQATVNHITIVQQVPVTNAAKVP